MLKRSWRRFSMSSMPRAFWKMGVKYCLPKGEI